MYTSHYSCLGNSMDRGTWRPTIHGVTKSRTRLSDEQQRVCTYTTHFAEQQKLTQHGKAAVGQ